MSEGAGSLEHAEFIAELERRLGGREAAVAALDAFVGAVSQEVALGGRVALTGFGVLTQSPRGRARGLVRDSGLAPLSVML